MIGKKHPIYESQIIDWIYKNSNARNGSKVDFDMQDHGKFVKNMKRVLKEFREEVTILLEKQNVKVQKIGTIFKVQSNKQAKINIKYQVQFYHHFTSASNANIKEMIKQGAAINYEKIAGYSFVGLKFTKFAIFSYINAGMQLASSSSDRKVYLDLGPVSLCFYQNKVAIQQTVKHKQNRSSLNIQRLLMNQININKQRWNDAVEGCMYDRLNIKRIKNNLDKGAEITIKFAKIEKHN